MIDDVEIKVMNDRGTGHEDAVNNSCIVYKAIIKEKSIIFLGDLGYYGGEELLKSCGASELKSDIVQMAHHG